MERDIDVAIAETERLLRETFDKLDPDRDGWFITRLTKIMESLADRANSDPPVPKDPSDRGPSKIIPTCDCFVDKGMVWDRNLRLYACSKCGNYEDFSGRSRHQQAVDEFMLQLRGPDCVRDTPTVPSPDERMHRIKILLPEVLELAHELHVGIQADWNDGDGPVLNPLYLRYFHYNEEVSSPINLAEVAKEAGDVLSAATGTLSVCGIDDLEVMELVDSNNIHKVNPPCPNCKEIMKPLMGGQRPVTKIFPPPKVDSNHVGWSCIACETHYDLPVGGYLDKSGKWIKGSTFRKLDLTKTIERMKDVQ